MAVAINDNASSSTGTLGKQEDFTGEGNVVCPKFDRCANLNKLENISNQCLCVFTGPGHRLEDFEIENLSSSFAVLLDQAANVVISKLRKCKVFILSVAESVLIQGCSDCEFVVTCEHLTVCESRDCVLRVLTHEPVSIKESTGIVFGRYTSADDNASDYFEQRLKRFRENVPDCVQVTDDLFCEADGMLKSSYRLIPQEDEKAGALRISQILAIVESTIKDRVVDSSVYDGPQDLLLKSTSGQFDRSSYDQSLNSNSSNSSGVSLATSKEELSSVNENSGAPLDFASRVRLKDEEGERLRENMKEKAEEELDELYATRANANAVKQASNRDQEKITRGTLERKFSGATWDKVMSLIDTNNTKNQKRMFEVLHCMKKL